MKNLLNHSWKVWRSANRTKTNVFLRKQTFTSKPFPEVSGGRVTRRSPVVRNQRLTYSQLREDLDHDLHGGVVGDRDGAQVDDVEEPDRRRFVRRRLGRGGVQSEEDFRTAQHVLVVEARVLCNKARACVRWMEW